MSRTFDEDGNQLDGVGASSTYRPPDSIGAALWEYLHPSEVQAEYVAMGQTPPSTAEIMSKSGVHINRMMGTVTPVGVAAEAAAAGIDISFETAQQVTAGIESAKKGISDFLDRAGDVAGDFGREAGKWVLIGAALWVAVEALRASRRT